MLEEDLRGQLEVVRRSAPDTSPLVNNFLSTSPLRKKRDRLRKSLIIAVSCVLGAASITLLVSYRTDESSVTNVSESPLANDEIPVVPIQEQVSIFDKDDVREVSGRLQVDETGCLKVGGAYIFAPFGSSVSSDGLRMPTYGQFRVDDLVTLNAVPTQFEKSKDTSDVVARCQAQESGADFWLVVDNAG